MKNPVEGTPFELKLNMIYDAVEKADLGEPSEDPDEFFKDLDHVKESLRDTFPNPDPEELLFFVGALAVTVLSSVSLVERAFNVAELYRLALEIDRG